MFKIMMPTTATIRMYDAGCGFKYSFFWKNIKSNIGCFKVIFNKKGVKGEKAPILKTMFLICNL